MNSRSRSMLVISVAAVTVAGITLGLAQAADSAPSSGKAALIGVLGISLGLSIVLLFHARVAPLSPYAIFIYSHSAIFVLRPTYNALAQGGSNIFTGADTGWPMVAAGILGALGFVAVSLGYAVVARGRGASRSRRASNDLAPIRIWDEAVVSRERTVVGLSVLTFVGGAILYAGYIRHLGGLQSFLTLNSGRSAELTQALAGSSGYEVSGLLLTTGTSLLVVTIGMIRHRGRLVLLGGALLLVAEVPQFMTGSRSMFVPMALAILIIVTITRPGVVTFGRAVVFGVPAFVLLFVAPRILRSEVTATNTATDALKEAFSAQAVMNGFFGGLDTAMIDAFALQIGAQNSGALNFAGGSTYLAALGAAVPRAIWPDKPLAVDTVLNQTLFPATAAKDIGFSFGIYSEPYFNWGAVGIVLVAVLFGLVLGKLAEVLRRTTSAFALVTVAMFSGQVFTLVRGSLSFDLQRFLIPLIPMVLVWVVAGLLTESNSARRRGRTVRSSQPREQV